VLFLKHTWWVLFLKHTWLVLLLKRVMCTEFDIHVFICSRLSFLGFLVLELNFIYVYLQCTYIVKKRLPESNMVATSRFLLKLLLKQWIYTISQMVGKVRNQFYCSIMSVFRFILHSWQTKRELWIWFVLYTKRTRNSSRVE
jgi:hypothetical protein